MRARPARPGVHRHVPRVASPHEDPRRPVHRRAAGKATAHPDEDPLDRRRRESTVVDYGQADWVHPEVVVAHRSRRAACVIDSVPIEVPEVRDDRTVWVVRPRRGERDKLPDEGGGRPVGERGDRRLVRGADPNGLGLGVRRAEVVGDGEGDRVAPSRGELVVDDASGHWRGPVAEVPLVGRDRSIRIRRSRSVEADPGEDTRRGGRDGERGDRRLVRGADPDGPGLGVRRAEVVGDGEGDRVAPSRGELVVDDASGHWRGPVAEVPLVGRDRSIRIRRSRSVEADPGEDTRRGGRDGERGDRRLVRGADRLEGCVDPGRRPAEDRHAGAPVSVAALRQDDLVIAGQDGLRARGIPDVGAVERDPGSAGGRVDDEGPVGRNRPRDDLEARPVLSICWLRQNAENLCLKL